MKDVSIVIPYSPSLNDPLRSELFSFVKSWWNFHFQDSPIVTAQSYNEDGSFNRAKSRNLAVKAVETKYMIIADADTICPPSALVKAFDLIRDKIPYASWVLPYANQNYYNLTDECTKKIISNGIKKELPSETQLIYEHKLQSWAGLICLSKSGYEAVGGYDERFIGWGYEDNAFRLALDTLWAPHDRIDSYCVHLWHAAPEDERFNQPNIHQNRRLYEKYLAAFNHRLAMKNLKGLN